MAVPSRALASDTPGSWAGTTQRMGPPEHTALVFCLLASRRPMTCEDTPHSPFPGSFV